MNGNMTSALQDLLSGHRFNNKLVNRSLLKISFVFAEPALPYSI